MYKLLKNITELYHLGVKSGILGLACDSTAYNFGRITLYGIDMALQIATLLPLTLGQGH